MAAGIALAYFADRLLENFADGVLLPLIRNAFEDHGAYRKLTVSVIGTTLDFGSIIEEAFVLLVACAIAYVLVVRQTASDGYGETSPRCPECRSNIRLGAHRCPACRTALGRSE
jgi:large-conductance mechanosensitive channel